LAAFNRALKLGLEVAGFPREGAPFLVAGAAIPKMVTLSISGNPFIISGMAGAYGHPKKFLVGHETL
jgi:hypothetical protein